MIPTCRKLERAIGGKRNGSRVNQLSSCFVWVWLAPWKCEIRFLFLLVSKCVLNNRAIMAADPAIKKFLSLNGINVRSDGVQYLSAIVKGKNEKDRKNLLDQVVRFIQRQPESSSIVSKQEIEIAVKDFTIQDDSEGADFFWVIDAFDVPRMVYDADKKQFHHAAAIGIPPLPLHADAEWKALSYVERYEMLFQRTLRYPLFCRSSMEKKPEEGKFALYVIEELLSSSSALHAVCVLGMISSLHDEKVHLEDPTGVVELQITAMTDYHVGLFTHNVFVIVEGWYEDGVLRATGIGMPPGETREQFRVMFGDFNVFGGPSQLSFKASSKMAQIEKQNPDATFVIVSDVWLDNSDVIRGLETMMEGFENAPPFCFVFCGDFVSEDGSLDKEQALQDGFKRLSTIIQQHPTILQASKFVFVPGPEDPGPSGILPRPRVPKALTEDIEKAIPNCVFTTNPCRIQYCTREIAIIREDILTKICRTLIKEPMIKPNETRFQALTRNLARTITAQGHICPLEPHVMPSYWSFDHAMRLYALPDLVVVADIHEPFTEPAEGCLIASPSSFPRHRFQFHVYTPATNTLDLSQLPAAESQ